MAPTGGLVRSCAPRDVRYAGGLWGESFDNEFGIFDVLNKLTVIYRNLI